ncbi:MAG: hypothetical protein B6I20_03520 [Bacteroidetes bacterium 4572_117]|nr:MAG: hypothetical protein B6I20_03520 [Bacteroidetes bacterium 4572_117]
MSKSSYQNYIDLYTSVAVRQRGQRLYKNSAVIEAKYDKQRYIWRFIVLGSRRYTVQVKLDAKQNIKSTSCTCPFDWGTICKHSVAALMYIDKNGQNIEKQTALPKKNISERTKKDEFELKNYKQITEEFIRENTERYIHQHMYYYSGNDTLKESVIKKDEIIFFLEISYERYVVKIKHSNNKVFIKSDENSKVKKLKKSEAVCLQMIAHSQNPDLLDIIFSDKIDIAKKNILGLYGLETGVNFEEYFEYLFSEDNGLSLYRLEKAFGLLPITESHVDNMLNIINHTAEDTQPQLPNRLTEQEKRSLGFVLRFEKAYYSYSDDSFNIVPIIGKPNKANTTLNTRIEELEDYAFSKYNLKVTENQKKILGIIDEQENFEDTEKNNGLKKIIQLLAKEPFVYTTVDSNHKMRKKDLVKTTVSENPADLQFTVSEDNDFVRAKMNIKTTEGLYPIEEPDTIMAQFNLYERNNVIYSINNIKSSELILNSPGEFKMVKTHKNNFYEQVIEPLSKSYRFDFKDNTYKVETINLDFHKKQIFLSEQNDFLIIKPQVVYDNDTSVVLYHTGDILSKTDDNITEYKRNFDLENDFLNLIAELHPEFESQKDNKLFYLHNEDFTKNMWFYNFFDQMQHHHVEVFGLKELKNFKYSPYKGKINTSVSSGQDWFEVNVDLSFGDNTVSLQDIKKAIINKQKYIQLKDGSVGIMPSDWLHKLEKYFRNGEIKKDKLEISKLRFSIIDEMFDDINDTEVLKEIAEKQKRLSEFKEIKKVKIPKEISAELRDYQKEGLNWLNFLDKMKWGGILADDMGLGKTLQILTFIQHLSKKKKSTNLIVVPTTLLFNWQNEIAKFSPKLKAFYHYGPNRKRETKHFKDYDLIFTTYGTLLRDIELLNTFKFNYLILDESQAIKNPASRRYKAAVLINANNKIAMTGTPIENSTFDLFAQMNFANPGMFGSLKGFKDNYSNPIDKDGDEIVAGELQKIINPFVLRRTKEKVASELPQKTEDIIYCEMEPEQRKVYDAYRNNYKDKLLNKIADDGIGKSKMMVLEALTRLRQICDSPVLLKNDEISVQQSIKVKEIIRHINEKTANHKILIFSQFVGMLTIVKDELNKLNVDYEYLDGKSSAKQRETSVNNFQKNGNLRVFMISLKAGGLGLNLTAADYVYILDPWWNPAVENQAIDRCYRIGQDKKVFAYRMICKNTVEEKILKLQAKKKKIATDIIQTDENIMKTIDTNDIKELFS